MSKLTNILAAMEQGQSQAAEELLPLVYEELRRLAAWRLAQERPGQTLQATALVHEAWLKLAGGEAERRWNDRTHFFAAAAEAMRRILVDNARRKRCARHGGELERVDLAAIQVPAPVQDEDDLLAVHEALDELAALHPPKAELVKLSAMNYDWLKELLAKDPSAIRHIVLPTGEKPDDRRIVLRADTAELQEFLLKHLKTEGPLVYQPGEGWQHLNTEGMWETSVELQPIAANSPSR